MATIGDPPFSWEEEKERLSMHLRNQAWPILDVTAEKVTDGTISEDKITKGFVPSSLARLTPDQYFMKIAHVAKLRATCPRLHCGCVIVVDGDIVSTGYNGSLPGMPHCDDAGCDMLDGHCVRTMHAEMNAVVRAAKKGVPLRRGTAYITSFPCWLCTKLLITAGIARIVTDSLYRPDNRVYAACRASFVSLEGIAA